MSISKLLLLAGLALIGTTFGSPKTLRNEPHHTEAQQFFDSIPADEKDYFLSYALALEIAKDDDDPSTLALALATHGETVVSDDYAIRVPDDLDIPPDVLEHFETMDIPAAFPSGLYHWVRDEYSMSEHELTVLAVESEYCFPDGHCVDLNDVGNTCCPF